MDRSHFNFDKPQISEFPPVVPPDYYAMKYAKTKDSVDFQPVRLQRYQSTNELIPHEPNSNSTEYDFAEQKVFSTSKRMKFIRKVVKEIRYSRYKLTKITFNSRFIFCWDCV